MDRIERLLRALLAAASGVGLVILLYVLLVLETAPRTGLPMQDKLFHALAFFCVAAPAFAALGRDRRGVWFAFMTAVAAASEIAQAVQGTGRQGSALDFAADLAGVAAAAWLGGRAGDWLDRLSPAAARPAPRNR